MSSMDTGLLDIAIPSASADTGSTSGVETTVDTPTVEAGTGDVTVGSGATQGSEQVVEGAEETPELNDDGSPVTPEQKSERAMLEDKKLPVEARKLLKGLKEANPNNPQVAKLVRDIHTQYERGRAYQDVYPTVQEARDAKEFLRELAGVDAGQPVTLQQARESYTRTMDIINNVNESDQLLYAGDGALIKNIFEDMKSEGVEANFGKLASPFLETLQANDPSAYTKAITPHVVSQLHESGFPQVLSQLLKSTQGTSAEQTVKNLVKWWNSAVDGVDRAKQGPSEKELAFEKEKQTFEQNKTKEFQNSVATEAVKTNIAKLGKELAPFLAKPYFKGFGKENLRPLANQIQANLQEELTADKAYQIQMKALWAAKSPDRSKILQYHNTKVESIAPRIVRDTVNSMYPTWSAGGSAAGRVAAAKQKADAQAKAMAQQKNQVASGQNVTPVKVAAKPKNINREMDKNNLLEIAGKGWVPNGKGGHILVTWR